MRKGPVTIKDIAQELSISPSTVSRALADNPLVKASTRETVKKPG
ncbi:MAG: LacI family DNA-binding transcriptional regulator [Cyclobacteriaceae bacterium]|nr:LacI family DNA-binding transcriptional regulator [Cyclobacteriaceae bacterium HetDA_MAG_MS6]